jgi:hypothetical protein
MSSSALFAPFYVAIDGNGKPMSGAQWFFYKTGTTTLQNTYADAGLETPNANPVVADSNGLFPSIYLAGGSDYKAILKTAAGVTVATRDPVEAPAVTPAATPLPGYLFGLGLSTAGSSAIFGVAIGAAADSTNSALMTLAVATTKTTSSWQAGAGNGALDTGTIANSTWYHVYLIYSPGSNLVDVLVSTSASSPTMPATYTQYRRIGSMKTDGSAQWTKFIQAGDDFWWNTPTVDVDTTTTTSATLLTVNVPLGLSVVYRCSLRMGIGGTATAILLTSPLVADTAPATEGPLSASLSLPTTSDSGNGMHAILTNTDQKIRSRATTAGLGHVITCFGYTDRRGRDA